MRCVKHAEADPRVLFTEVMYRFNLSLVSILFIPQTIRCEFQYVA